MALYRNGTAGMTANGVVTGVGTNWQDKLSLVRVGATIVFMTQPLTLAVVSAIVSPTELRVIQSENVVVPDGTKYVILLHDSITVDGLAQDVAETLRYYQSKETEIEAAVDFFKTFDLKTLQDLQAAIRVDADRTSANAESAWNARNQAESLAHEASASKDASAISAQQSANYANLASGSAGAAQSDANRAKAEADRAATANPDNQLKKANNLSDVQDKSAARANLSLDRVVQTPTYTSITARDGSRMVLFGGKVVSFIDGPSDTPFGLPISAGGSGAIDAAGARQNFGLGLLSTPQFQHLTLASVNASSSGAVLLYRNTANQVMVSQGRIYTEVQAGVHKMTFQISNDGDTASSFVQIDQNAQLTGVSNQTLSGTLAAKTVTTAGWVNGGDKGLSLRSTADDQANGNFVNYIQGNFYKANWQFGGVRGAGANLDRVQLNVVSGDGSAASFGFNPRSGGYMGGFKGVKGSLSTGGWGFDQYLMSAPFWCDQLTGNNASYMPIVSGATATASGWGTRTSFGAIANGNGQWASAAISLLGDNTHLRAFQFSKDGDIITWGNGSFATGDFTFQKAPTSDRDLKKDITYTAGKESYDRVKKWLPTLFKYKGSDIQRYGFIAQDLMKVDPQYVKLIPGKPIFETVTGVDENGEEYEDRQVEVDRADDTLALDSNVMLADLGCAFVYQSEQVDRLSKEVEDLKALVQSLIAK